jgi:hypothetical protein
MGRSYTSFIRVRKTIFALFAVLLVLLLAACDFIELPRGGGDDLPNIPNDGMVSLTIGVGGGGTGRALTTDLAKAGVNYYEVVFKSGSTLYQIGFNSGDPPLDRTISLPVGNYSGPESAVMFAGNKNLSGTDYTLLAIGVIDSTVTGGSTVPNSGLIASNTTQITFLLSAITNDVNTNQVTSTFKIVGPTSANDGSGNYATAGAGSIPTTIDTRYPVFRVPPAAYINTDTTFTYDSGDPSYLLENIVGSYTFNNANFAGVGLASGGWTATPAPYSGGGETPVTGVVIHPESLIPGVKIDTIGGVFNFVVDVSGASATPGLCAVSIDVQVYALGATALKAPSYSPGPTITWHIRGGSINTDPDEGKDLPPNGSAGGAVLLGVGYP